MIATAAYPNSAPGTELTPLSATSSEAMVPPAVADVIKQRRLLGYEPRQALQKAS